MSASAACNAALPAVLGALCKKEALEEWPAGKLAERWHAVLSKPLPKGIKYAKAVQRILGHPAPLYVGVEYKDVSLFLDEEFSSIVKAPLDAEGWRALQAANRLAACALGIDIDRAPSREEIQQNIHAVQMAKKKPETSSVSQACKMTYVGLGEALGDEAATRALSERAAAVDDKELTAAWAAMLQERPGFADECAQRQPPPMEAWTAVPPAARQALCAALAGSRDAKAWSSVDQMNGYSKITSNIPTGVMSKIETMASRLASDLQSGSVTMETLNLQNIGEQVLSDCSESDLSKLTGNIGDLLPVLSQMAPGAMPGGFPGMPGGIPGMPNVTPVDLSKTS